MSEPEQPKILSLEEVREIALFASQPGEWNSHYLARLCATVQHYADDLIIARALYRDTSYCEKCDRCHDTRTGCEADIRRDERERVGAENARLSVLVARLREALAEAGIALESIQSGCTYELAPPLREGIGKALSEHIRPLLTDPDGQHAAEELRLLRAWEVAHRSKLDALDLAPYDRLVRGRAIEETESQAGRAWAALEEFREKTL